MIRSLLRVSAVGLLTTQGACGGVGPGEAHWVRLHDGEAGHVDRALCVVSHADGVVVGGWTSAPGPNGDVARLWLAGHDAGGATTFTVSEKASDTRGVFASDVAVLEDGSLVVAGGEDRREPGAESANWDVWVALYAPNRTRQWIWQRDGNGGEDQAVAVSVGPDDVIVVGGYESRTTTDVDGHLWTFDREGNLVDETIHEGPGGGLDVVVEVDHFPGGDLIAVGYMTSGVADDQTDVWMLRRGADGTTRFETLLAHPGLDRGQAVAVVDEQTFVVGGYRYEPGRALDAFVSMHGPDGEVDWEVVTDGPGGFADAVNDVAVGPDGDVYAAGYVFVKEAGFDAVVWRHEADGTLAWEYRRAGPAGADDVAAAVTVDDRGRVFAAGAQTQHQDDDLRDLDAWLVRLQP